MGFLSDVFGGGSRAKKGSRRQIEDINNAIGEIRQGGSQALATLQPLTQGGFIQQAGEAASVGGLDQRLSQILGSDNFTALRDERARSAGNFLSAQGSRRSGLAANTVADLSQSTAFDIEGLLAGRLGGLAGLEADAVNNTANLQLGIADQIASLLGNRGAVKNQSQLNQLNANRGGFQNALNLGGTIASGFAASDPRLKTNIVPIATLGPLGVYTWDWKDGTGSGLGVMADEVAHFYPHLVAERDDGYMMVNYQELLEAA